MSVANHVAALKRRHAELEDQIRSLELSPGADEIEIHDLKKQKLRLKDEIASFEKEAA